MRGRAVPLPRLAICGRKGVCARPSSGVGGGIKLGARFTAAGGKLAASVTGFAVHATIVRIIAPINMRS
jgi:hypothetical protein